MIDLHIHSDHSDGSYPVEYLLTEAENRKVSLISITDHNIVDAYQELEIPSIREIFSGEILTGVELSATYRSECIEILGYGFNVPIMKKLIEENYYGYEEKQIKEFELIRDRYNELGIKFDVKKVYSNCNFKHHSSRGAFLKEIAKYPENYKFFLNEKAINNVRLFSRQEVYNPKSPLYVDQSPLFPTIDKTIEIIHKAGGKAFLAHLYQYSNQVIDSLEELVTEHRPDGIECYHSSFTAVQMKYLTEFCKKKGILISGGSDYHGKSKPTYFIGIGENNLNISETMVNDWISTLEKL